MMTGADMVHYDEQCQKKERHAAFIKRSQDAIRKHMVMQVSRPGLKAEMRDKIRQDALVPKEFEEELRLRLALCYLHSYSPGIENEEFALNFADCL